MKERGYLTGREVSKIREHVFRRLAMIFIKDGLKSIREETTTSRRGHHYIPSKSAFIDALGAERALIISIIALTVADLGAGDRVEINTDGKTLRKSAYEALWGKYRFHMEMLCDMIDLNIHEVHKLGYAMLRYMSDRLIHSKEPDYDIIAEKQHPFHPALEGGSHERYRTFAQH